MIEIIIISTFILTICAFISCKARNDELKKLLCDETNKVRHKIFDCTYKLPQRDEYKRLALECLNDVNGKLILTSELSAKLDRVENILNCYAHDEQTRCLARRPMPIRSTEDSQVSDAEIYRWAFGMPMHAWNSEECRNYFNANHGKYFTLRGDGFVNYNLTAIKALYLYLKKNGAIK